MKEWQRINKVFDEADKIKALKKLYMERGNVSSEEAFQWALKKWNDSTNSHKYLNNESK